MNPTSTRLSLALLVPILALSGAAASDEHHSDLAPDLDRWRTDPRVEAALLQTDPGCEFCHGAIENAVGEMGTGFELACTFCHGGNGSLIFKDAAHVQPTLPVIMDATVAPLDYDLEYQRFVNPSNLRVVEDTCGICHFLKPPNLKKGMMTTAAGHYAGGLWLNGVVDTKTPIYGTFAITDDDGEVPIDEGAVPGLLDLITYDPALDPSLVSTHFRSVPGQACARCHLWSRGKGYRGAVDKDGTYRADGCAGCHMPYSDDGRSQSADNSIDHLQQGHPIGHTITAAVPTSQCLHCHHRGSRIGLNFTGRAQMPPRLPSGPGVVGTTDVRFNGNYHYVDGETNPQDVHGENGMQCIDCHTSNELMGDGNIYGHMDQATKVECRQCHGTPETPGTLVDHDGLALNNVERIGNDVVLTSKVGGGQHDVTQLVDLLNADSASYNARAGCAMNDDHIKEEGGLECYACHTSWVPNCFGCHFTRDEREMGQNLVTRQWEVGKASTNNKVYESLKHYAYGLNAEGRFAPYLVSCQVVSDVTAPDGSKILDFVMPTTDSGLSGLGLNPVNPHTIRGAGEVRSCAECHRSPPSLGLGSGNYAIARDRAYAASINGVHVFDRKADPTDPPLLATLPVATPVALAALPDVIEGTADYLYVAAGANGLAIFDMRSGIPTSAVTTVSGIDAIDVSRVARYLYVTVDGVGVAIYDNQDPSQAVPVTTIPIPSARRAVPWGIHLFVAAGSAGLVVVDISDHTAPAVVGTVPGINAADVTLYAHMQKGPDFAARAYVADPDYGVRIVDLLPDFALAHLVGGLPLAGASGLDTYTRYVEADATTPSREHDYLYVAAGNAGLRIYDITDPDAVIEVASIPDLGGVAEDVDVSSDLTPPGVDDYAMIANSVLGLQVVEVTDPQAPLLLNSVSAAGTLRVRVDVQQLDRFIDEQGTHLKENSHPGIEILDRADIVRLLSVPLGECAVGGCCDGDGGCAEMNNLDCAVRAGEFGGPASGCFDTDTDGWSDICDCAPADDQAWRRPGETGLLVLGHDGGTVGSTTLSWSEPGETGAVTIGYDSVYTSAAADFVTPAVCLESYGADTESIHSTAPASEEVLYFLVRAANDCSPGSAGTASSGTEREVRTCP